MSEDRRGRDARRWTRNAIAELTVAINEASQVLITDDDKVAQGYLGNVRSAMVKAQDYVTRAKIMLEGEQ